MSDKFLSGRTDANLSNGSVTLFGATIGALSLDPSQPVKTNSVRQLVSSKLDIADIYNLQSILDGTVSNPLESQINFAGYNAVGVGDLSFTKAASKPASAVGALKLYANSDGFYHQVDEAGTDIVVGDIFDQELNTTDDVEFKQLDISLNGTDGIRLRNGSIASPDTLLLEDYIGNTSNLIIGGNSQLLAISPATVIFGATGGNTYIRNLTLGGFLSPGNYTLPTTRGTVNQILQTNAVGVVSWVDQSASNPFNQTLNKADTVQFGGLQITPTGDAPISLGNGGFSSFSRYSNTLGGVGWSAIRGRGTALAPLAIISGDTVYSLLSTAYDGASLIDVARFRSYASQNHTVGAGGTGYDIDITPNGTVGRRPYFRLDSTALAVGDISGGTFYTLPIARATQPYSALVDNTPNGGVSWLSLKNAWGQIYYNGNLTNNTFAATNTYYDIEGTWIVPGLINSGFTQSFAPTLPGNSLKYTGVNPRVFKVDCSGSAKSIGVSNKTLQLGFHIDGFLITSGQVSFKVDDSVDYPTCFSLSTLITVSTNSIISIKVQNLSDTQTILIGDICLNIVGLGI